MTNLNGPKADKIERMFDSIAGDYDRLNHILSLDADRLWRRKALRQIIEPGKAQDILDVACGTGDFTIAIAGAMSPGSRITGMDLSEGMLEVMRRKINALPEADAITTLQGNCEHLPFEDASFDRVTIAFGIRNFEHREDALREILRVLRPGGRLVILELGVPSGKLTGIVYRAYFQLILPRIGGMVSGDKAAYRYLPASVLNFPGPEEWCPVMESCGFTGVTHKALSFGICRMYTADKAI